MFNTSNAQRLHFKTLLAQLNEAQVLLLRECSFLFYLDFFLVNFVQKFEKAFEKLFEFF